MEKTDLVYYRVVQKQTDGTPADIDPATLPEDLLPKFENTRRNYRKQTGRDPFGFVLINDDVYALSGSI